MATLPLFNDGTPFKQTDDSDASRLNDYPSIIRDNSGRLILFYEKYFRSGVLTGGVVSFVSPSLDCDIEAGTGTINGTPVTWSADTLTLTPDTYTLVYVDSAGNIGQTSDFPISFVKNVIILAYVNVGATTIVRISNLEKEGNYIYNRRQILSGSDYVWDGYESRLNTGEKPEVFFDSTNNKAYCTFIKDGATYTRVFDTTNELTWEDINHTEETGGVLYPVPQPRAELVLDTGCSQADSTVSQPILFDFGRSFAVGLHIDTSAPYVHLPYVSSSFISAMIPPATMQVFTKSGLVYSLEAEFNIEAEDSPTGLTTSWAYTRGTKYLGLVVNHNLYVDDYITDPSDYVEVLIPNKIDSTEIVSPTKLDATIFPEVWDLEVGCSDATIIKDTEYGQLFRWGDDSLSDLEVGCSDATIMKDAEYSQVFEFESDSLSNLEVGCSDASHSIV
jgi:hypothetical protein